MTTEHLLFVSFHKAFGVPTWGVKQPGHAAMSRFVSRENGWVTCLGGGFSRSYWDGRCGNDFVLETQARNSVEADPCCCEVFPYLRQVLRLEMLASYYMERDDSIRKYCMVDASGKSPWYNLSLLQRTLLAAKDKETIHVSKKPLKPQQQMCLLSPAVAETIIIEAQIMKSKGPKKLQLHSNERIIPATNCSNPTKSTKKVQFMKSYLGGQQLFLLSDGEVEYTIAFSGQSAASKTSNSSVKAYNLSCYVCTVHHGEKPLMATITTYHDGGTRAIKQNPVTILKFPIPYTVGVWMESEPIEIELDNDAIKTTISLKREANQYGGIAMKYLRLVEVMKKQEMSSGC